MTREFPIPTKTLTPRRPLLVGKGGGWKVRVSSPGTNSAVATIGHTPLKFGSVWRGREEQGRIKASDMDIDGIGEMGSSTSTSTSSGLGREGSLRLRLRSACRDDSGKIREGRWKSGSGLEKVGLGVVSCTDIGPTLSQSETVSGFSWFCCLE